jgi:tRNA(fMet)-specific endonuclease VapC
MDYLLDTNACIGLINGTPEPVREHMRKAVDGGARLFTSSIVLFELWYGVAKSSRREANAQRVAVFLSGPVTVLAFDDSDSRTAGSIRATLESSGRPIGAYDLLIAGQAMARELTLVTANVKEFARVKGLQWEDWAKPRL